MYHCWVPVWHVSLLSVQWINSWWWTEELSETCRVSCKNNFVKLVHLVGFIIKKCVTMQHGHTKLKLVQYYFNYSTHQCSSTWSIYKGTNFTWESKRLHKNSFLQFKPVITLQGPVFRCEEYWSLKGKELPYIGILPTVNTFWSTDDSPVPHIFARCPDVQFCRKLL